MVVVLGTYGCQGVCVCVICFFVFYPPLHNELHMHSCGSALKFWCFKKVLIRVCVVCDLVTCTVLTEYIDVEETNMDMVCVCLPELKDCVGKSIGKSGNTGGKTTLESKSRIVSMYLLV